MAFYQTPGVYVEEVDSVSQPIEVGGTNTVGFLGVAEKGPIGEATLIRDWSHYKRRERQLFCRRRQRQDCRQDLLH